MEGLRPDLDTILTKWRWLVPSDVDVRIRWGDCDGDYAESHAMLDAGRLLITVSPPDFNPPLMHGFEIPRDVESDIVHELLHWRAEGYRPKRDGSTEHQMWEAAVERTAQDLLKLDRRTQ